MRFLASAMVGRPWMSNSGEILGQRCQDGRARVEPGMTQWPLRSTNSSPFSAGRRLRLRHRDENFLAAYDHGGSPRCLRVLGNRCGVFVRVDGASFLSRFMDCADSCGAKEIMPPKLIEKKTKGNVTAMALGLRPNRSGRCNHRHYKRASNWYKLEE